MDPILTESEFWKHLIEKYELGEKFDSIVSNTCTSWARITRVSTVESSTVSVVLLDNKIRLEVSRAVSDGENFMSQVFRLHATVGENEYQCFLKVLPQNPSLRDIARKLEYHQREISMYSNIFPYLHHQLIEADLNPSEYLHVPKLYYSNMSLNDSGLPTSQTILVTEDLRLRGFRMVDKVQGCDLEHAKCALRSLAYFHATSNIMLRKLKAEPELGNILEIFTKTAPETAPLVLNVFETAFQTPKRAVEQMGYLVIANKLSELTKNLALDLAREMPEQIGVLACLNHGDYWINNMLFQYDPESGLPVAASMVDWQLSSVGHPAKDIGYFLMTSTTKSLWRDHWKELLQEYFEHLRTLLCLLGLDLLELGYTKTDFLNEFAARMHKSIPFASIVLPIILDETVAAKFQHVGSNGTYHAVDIAETHDFNPETKDNFSKTISVDTLLSNPEWRDRYLDLLLELMGRGWL